MSCLFNTLQHVSFVHVQEADIEIEYVSAPQDFESLSLDEPAAPSQPAPAHGDDAEAHAMDSDAAADVLDRQASGDMADTPGLGLGATAGLGLGATPGLGLGATPGLGLGASEAPDDRQEDEEEADPAPGLGTIPAWAKGGLGFTKASEPSLPIVSEAERKQAMQDLQRVMAQFTRAEELTGTAPAADDLEASGDAQQATTKASIHLPYHTKALS